MSGSSSPKLRVLVAEDDRALADILRIALSRLGWDVIVAHNGLAALRIAQASAFDAIVSDFQMPGLNGEQLLSAVRESGASREAVLILSSAKSYELDSERLRNELGLSAVFYKPFSLHELAAALRELLAAAPVA